MTVVDWDALHLVLEIHRAGSLAGAARCLQVNPSTAGRRLAAFESAFGAQVFARTSDGLVATEAGANLIDHAEHMEHHAVRAVRSIEGETAKLEGVVRVAMPTAFGSHFLVDHLQELRHRHPNITIQISGADRLEDLTRGEIDLAVRFSRPGSGVPVAGGHGDVVAQRVALATIGVYASRAYLERMGTPTHADDVRGHSIVVVSNDAAHFPGAAWTEAVVLHNRIGAQADSMALAASAIAAGLGIGVLPAFMAAKIPNVRAIKPPDAVDARELWLLVPADQRRVARVRAVRDFIVELVEHWEPIFSGRLVGAELASSRRQA